MTDTTTPPIGTSVAHPQVTSWAECLHVHAEGWHGGKALLSSVVGIAALIMLSSHQLLFIVLGVLLLSAVVVAAVVSRFWTTVDGLHGWRKALVQAVVVIGGFASVIGWLGWLLSKRFAP